jgi:hypothetical protein
LVPIRSAEGFWTEDPVLVSLKYDLSFQDTGIEVAFATVNPANDTDVPYAFVIVKLRIPKGASAAIVTFRWAEFIELVTVAVIPIPLKLAAEAPSIFSP